MRIYKDAHAVYHFMGIVNISLYNSKHRLDKLAVFNVAYNPLADTIRNAVVTMHTFGTATEAKAFINDTHQGEVIAVGPFTKPYNGSIKDVMEIVHQHMTVSRKPSRQSRVSRSKR